MRDSFETRDKSLHANGRGRIHQPLLFFLLMNQCSPQLYRRYLETFSLPYPGARSYVTPGKIGLIQLSDETFRYAPDAIYTFATSAMEEEGTGRRLLFIRIDRRHPDPAGAEPDFCIPIAYANAPARERLVWTISFPGSWSDAREEALLVFEEEHWVTWFSELKEGVAFTSPGAQSACLLPFDERNGTAIREFCAALVRSRS